MQRFYQINGRAIMMFKPLRELAAREKKDLQDEILQVEGLMPLLMKRRNKQRWGADDKAPLASHDCCKSARGIHVQGAMRSGLIAVHPRP